jgi:hypothetical protein
MSDYHDQEKIQFFKDSLNIAILPKIASFFIRNTIHSTGTTLIILENLQTRVSMLVLSPIKATTVITESLKFP